MEGTRRPLAFISHASEDQVAVRKLARALLAQGIEVWLDEWEILPGDDIVAKINEGLEQCDAVLVVLSAAARPKPWVVAETSAATYARIQEGRAVIPISLDDTEPPPLLRPLMRVRIDEVERIADAIRTRSGAPQASQAPARGVRRIVVRLDRLDNRAVHVGAKSADRELTDVTHADLPDTLRSRARAFIFSRREWIRRGPDEARVSSLESDLLELGRELGRLCFPGEAGTALADAIDGAPASGTVEVVFEADDPELLGLPFEALRFADDRLLCAEPKVAMFRRPKELPGPLRVPPAGPIKVMVAVGAPDEGQTASVVLDSERELQNILDAVEAVQRGENFEVRILEVGHPEVIGDAAKRDTYHVLHVSCHGMPGALELENEEGGPHKTSAAEFVAGWELTDGRPLPLVFLNACHGGVNLPETASFAHELLKLGVPYVIAMQTSVSDTYATHLAREFYAELAKREPALPSRALAHARRVLEAKRRKAMARGDSAWDVQPEYATPALYVAGEERPLANFALDKEPLRERPVHEMGGPVPQLRIDDLIGRRKELRDTLRVIREAPGGKKGVVLTGIGGVGKSSVAGRAMRRLKEGGFQVAAHVGRWDLRGIAEAVGGGLLELDDPTARKVARDLTDGDLPDDLRWQRLTGALARHPIVLVLDDFERNLTTDGSDFEDPTTAVFLRKLLEGASNGRLLLTSRYPVPDTAAYLERVRIGPLSPAETRKLLLRLPSLAGRLPDDFRELLRRIGGHPRVLEFVDGILSGGEGRLPHVTEKLAKVAAEADVTFGQNLDDVSEAVQQALLLGARDVLLDELLDIARDGGIDEVLLQAAVSNLPVTAAGVAHMLVGEPSAKHTGTERALDRLEELSLVARVGDTDYIVHRWTAEGLALRAGQASTRERLARAGRYRIWRVTNETHAFADGIEAIRNLLGGQAFAEASEVAAETLLALQQANQTLEVAGLASEVLIDLPPDEKAYAAIADYEAQAHISLGFIDRARVRYTELAMAHARRARAEPDQAEHQRDLFVSYNKMGDLYSMLGQEDQAHEAFLQALRIAHRLANAEPDSATYQRDLSVSYNKMGDLHFARGRPDDAEEAFSHALRVVQRLASTEPDQANYQRDLAISYNKLGDLYNSRGQVDQAREEFLKGLQISQRLIDAEPQRADYQRDLAVCYHRIGDLYFANDQANRAHDAFLEAFRISQRLAKAEPDRTDYKRDLAACYSKFGDTYVVRGNTDKARKSFLQDLNIAEQLAEAEPNRADFQRDLAVSLERMALISASDTAKGYLNKAVAVRRRVLALSPEQGILRRELGIALFQHYTLTKHRPSLSESAALLVGLHRRNALEAQYHELAEQLAPIADQVEAELQKSATPQEPEDDSEE